MDGSLYLQNAAQDGVGFTSFEHQDIRSSPSYTTTMAVAGFVTEQLYPALFSCISLYLHTVEWDIQTTSSS